MNDSNRPPHGRTTHASCCTREGGHKRELTVDSLHIEFKSRHNSVVIEARKVVTLGRHEGLLGAGHAPFFNLNTGYPGRFIGSEFI